MRSRVKEAVARLRDDTDRAGDGEHHVAELREKQQTIPAIPGQAAIPEELRTSKPNGGAPESAGHKEETDLHPVSERAEEGAHPEPKGELHSNPSRANPAALFTTLFANDGVSGVRQSRSTSLTQCTTPLYLTVDDEKVAIDTQIQLYATNAQLCHPWISPVLGYLGGLPPLFICAGDNEVLRDEIIFLCVPQEWLIRLT
jgi:hypothetical protein